MIEFQKQWVMKMRQLRLVLSFVLLALVLIFAVQNVAVVEVQFLFWSLALPRSLLIFVVLSVGVIVGWFLRGAMRRSRG